MRGILPGFYWLVLAGLAAASIFLGLVKLREASLPSGQAKGLLTGRSIDPGFSQWVAGYSGGMRSAREAIRIQFTEPADSARRVGALKASLLTMRPAVSGKLVWEDARTLAFLPDTLLPYGKLFAAELDLSAVFDVKSERYRRFLFAFQTSPLRGRFSGLGFNPAGNLTATLETTDYLPASLAEKLTTLDGLSGNPTWQHSPDGKRHTLTLPDPRLPTPFQARLRADLRSLEGNIVGKELIVPSQGAFACLSTEETEGPDRSLLIHLTYPIDPRQDLKGLAYLKDIATSTAQAEGCDLRIPLPDDLFGARILVLNKAIRSQKGQDLATDQNIALDLRPALPALRLPGNGYIMPETGEQAFVSFEARDLRQAVVELYRIYPSNVPEFLASGNLDQPDEQFYQRTMGRPVGAVTVNLPDEARPGEFARYRVDVSRFMADAPGALHYVRVFFRPGQMRFPCPGIATESSGLTQVPDEAEHPNGDYDNTEGYYDDGERGWRGSYEDDVPSPCRDSYSYSSAVGVEGGKVNVGSYLMRSNLGLQARTGATGQLELIATDLRTAEPAEGVSVQILSKQHQVLAEARTNGQGMARANVPSLPAPCLLVGKSELGYAYLKIANSKALDYTPFADQLRGGAAIEEPGQLKGFLYTERGTYRPGDTLHVAFILQGAEAAGLEGPVVLEVTNPQGGSIYKRSRTETLGQHYRWNVPTDPSAPTGGYSLMVRAGSQSFYQRVGVEEIRPNRMAIQTRLSLPAFLEGTPGQAEVLARYLYGSPAAGLRLSVRSTAAMADFAPAGFEGYTFRDYNQPEPDLAAKPGLVLDGRTDADGKATLPFNTPDFGQKLYPVKLTFTTQVFEQGGQFSQQFGQTTVHPVPRYVGIKEIARPEAGSYGINQNLSLDLIEVDALTGKLSPIPATLAYTVTRLDWVWWYEDVGGQNLYNGSATQQAIRKGSVALQGGRGKLSLRLEKWGRYAVEVHDGATGHSASQVVYVGYPDDNASQNGDPMQRLKLSADKKLYAPGETARLRLPPLQANDGDRVLVSLEAGSSMLGSRWATVEKGMVEVEVPEEAAPNCYAHLTLLRPYNKAGTGTPMRAYGLLGLEVRGKDARLEPMLKAPAEGKPSEGLTVEVSEKAGRPMTYVLAMVDEGLLNLTNFKTPDPAPTLDGRRGLAVRAFDMFGQVLEKGAISGATLLTAGGDAFLKSAAMRDEARNSLAVEAISRVRGPFTLKPNEKARHTLPAPSYAGAVRWMLIANTLKTAASTEALTRVKADLILEASLPRVASIGDEIALPLEVESFLKTNSVATVEASVLSGPAALVGANRQTLSVGPRLGRQAARLALRMGKQEGLAVIKMTARSNGAVAERTFRLPVRQANRPQRRVSDFVLAKGQTMPWPADIPGAAPGPWQVEVATSPPLGLANRLDYLLGYPYGCAEQTVSAAVAQLFLPLVTVLDAPSAAKAEANVKTAVKSLRRYELGSGLLAPWPGMAEPDMAATAYACWFLQQTADKGYGQAAQQERLENALKRYLSNAAGPRHPAERNLHAFILYCLGEAADAAALNRLVQDKALPQQGRTLLAGAYLRRYEAFQAKTQLAYHAKPAGLYEGAYGSPIRDLAIAAALDQSINHEGAVVQNISPLLLKLADEVRTTPYLSTQELGWAFAALSLLPKGKADGQVRVAGQALPLTAKSRSIDIPKGKAAPGIANSGAGPAYVHLTQTYIPAPGREPEESEGLSLAVKYMDDLTRPLDPATLKQGRQFSAIVTVSNKSGIDLDRIALAQAMPGGWEISNDRLAASATDGGEARQPGLTYEDIRDDRVHRFFNLPRGKSITFRTRLTAAYRGRFALPALTAEAMYLPRYRATRKGGVVTIK